MLDAAEAANLPTAIGDNAGYVFGSLLLGLLLLVGLAWICVHRCAARRVFLSNARGMPVLAIVGIVVTLLASLLFVTVADALANDGWLPIADQALTDALQRGVPTPALRVLAQVTVLANTQFLWVLAIAGAMTLTWHRRYLLVCIWLVAFAGNSVLTRSLKVLFARARPLRDHRLIDVQGYSFPSGHSSGAVVAYGMLAYVLIRCTPMRWHLPIVLVATTTAFIVGCSRIFLQVHFASDVLAGFASGLAWLSLCVVVAEWGREIRAGT